MDWSGLNWPIRLTLIHCHAARTSAPEPGSVRRRCCQSVRRKASGAAGTQTAMEFVGAGIEKGQRKGGSQQLLSAQPPGAQAED